MIEPGQEQAGASPAPNEAGKVIAQLEQICRHVERIQSALASACGLRPPAYALLEIVMRHGENGITVSHAADLLGVRPQALAAPAGELADIGLITRTKDRTDGRARRLAATEAGAIRLDRTSRLRAKLQDEVKSQVPATNVAGLILGRLSTALGRALTPDRG